MNRLPVIQLTASDKADILRMRGKGTSLREIAEYIGCSINSVRYHLNAAGIHSRNRWTEELDKRLIELYNKGEKASDIAKMLCRSTANIEHRVSYLRKLNAPIKHHR